MATAFFIVAHSDDWFLFMGNAGLDAFGDGKNGNTICFVYVTATNAIDGTYNDTGDAVRELYERGLREREEATILMMADYFDAPADFAVKSLNGREIAYYEVANTRHYCLRLADGIVDGSGVAWNGRQSLRHLREQNLPMTAQGDIPATYATWSDLTATLRAIFDHEGGGQHIWLNYLDPVDASQPFPDGHSDHQHVGLAVQDATRDTDIYHHALFRGYTIRKGRVNVKDERAKGKRLLIKSWDDIQKKSGLYGSIMVPPYTEWATRQYMKDEEMPLEA